MEIDQLFEIVWFEKLTNFQNFTILKVKKKLHFGELKKKKICNLENFKKLSFTMWKILKN